MYYVGFLLLVLRSVVFTLRLGATLVVSIPLVAASLPIGFSSDGAESAACEPIWKPVHSPGTAASGNQWSAVATISPENAWAVGIGFEENMTIPISAHWNGRKWKSVSMPVVGDFLNHLYAVEGISSDNVWAAGIQQSKQGWRSNFLLHWNGENWRLVPSPQVSGGESGIRGIAAISADNVWAVGYQVQNPLAQNPMVQTLIMHWNGSEWTMSNSPNPGTKLNELLSINGHNQDDIWAVGRAVDDSGTSQPIALHYDGIAWSVVPAPQFESGYNVLTDVETISLNDAWAVGQYFDSGTSRSMNLTLHWDGSKWNTVLTPTPHPSMYDFPLRAVAVVHPNEIWAVGHDYREKKGFGVPLVLRRLGTGWTRTPVHSLGDWSNYLYDVAASSTNDLWAVGYYTGAPPKSIPLVQHYGPPVSRPRTIAPAKKQLLSGPSVLFDWDDLACANRYEIVVRRNSPTGIQVFRRIVMKLSQTRSDDFRPGKHYVWSVRGCNDDGCGFWSNWRSFQMAE